ncbi:MAG: ATP-dependent helicase [Candidatus Omnitrophota bacterium]
MSLKIDYRNELNSAQLEAAQFTDGPCLVIAGAGSGKTRILVYRVAHLVEQGIDPKNILLLTFTRKAAQEMLLRASDVLDKRCSAVSGGTFHSFANMVLRRYASRLRLSPNFSIMDQADAENTVKHVSAELGFLKISRNFPKKKALLSIISKSVNKSQDLELVIDAEYPHFLIYADEIEKIRSRYVEYKLQKYLLDYDDLLVYLKELLTAHEDIRHELSDRYKYIMVDEYQDTNKLQADILKLLLEKHNNIMVVGDDSQSIYSFRGADFRNIIDFPKQFRNTRIITLEENYRSVQPILDLTNRVISEAAEKFNKNLFSSRKSGNHPVYIDAENENDQSGQIMQKLIELTASGIKLGDIAVLFRAGWHSNDLEIELAKNNIPFVKYGGQKFIESAHIKDLVSHMRIAYNRFDEISWRRALLLMRGVGAKTAERLIEKLASNEKNIPLDDKLMKKSPDIQRLKTILNDIDPECQTPLEVFKAFARYYEPIFKERYDDFHKRQSDLESLENIAARYSNLEEFLTDMSLEPPEKSIVKAGMVGNNKDSLVLSTVHSAKGLEWHTVFIIYVAEGHMPSYQSFNDENSIEEERRLLYVAMTRAKENLYMLRPLMERSPRSYNVNNGSIFTSISRFLNGFF